MTLKNLLQALILSTAVPVLLSGCETVYGGANLTDETLKSEIAAALGTQPADISIQSRRTESLNTYANVTVRGGKQMVCRFSGGGWALAGMRTAPACNEMVGQK